MVKVNLNKARSKAKPKRKQAPRKQAPKKRRYEEEEEDDIYEDDDFYDEDFDDEDDYDYDEDDYDYDEDDYDYDDDEDEDEDEDEPRSKSRGESSFKKRAIQIGAGLLAIIVLAVGVRACSKDDKKEEQKQEEPKQEQVEKKSEETKEQAPSKEQEISVSKGLGREEEAAKNTLEKPDVYGTNADKEAVTKRIKASVEKLKEDKDKFKNNQDGGLSLTGYSMLSNFRVALDGGYEVDYDSIAVYKASADNVIQFTMKMKNKDGKILVFAGNYVPATDQAELAVMKGDLIPLDSAKASSPTGGKQVDNEKAKENSDKPLNPEKIKDA
jgi:hypothetical protein